MSAGAVSPGHSQDASSGGRTPLAQLLHALNQPLTGLQCSMEVALAMPRTPDQYQKGLRDGLELTSRMRELVIAIRELVEMQETAVSPEREEPLDVRAICGEAMEELAQLAEAKTIRLRSAWPCSAITLRGAQRRVAMELMFRTLEATLALASPTSDVVVEAGDYAEIKRAGVWIRVHWRAEHSMAAYSRPQLALLLAEAGWTRLGGKWSLNHGAVQNTITICFAR